MSWQRLCSFFTASWNCLDSTLIVSGQFFNGVLTVCWKCLDRLLTVSQRRDCRPTWDSGKSGSLSGHWSCFPQHYTTLHYITLHYTTLHYNTSLLFTLYYVTSPYYNLLVLLTTFHYLLFQNIRSFEWSHRHFINEQTLCSRGGSTSIFVNYCLINSASHPFPQYLQNNTSPTFHVSCVPCHM